MRARVYPMLCVTLCLTLLVVLVGACAPPAPTAAPQKPPAGAAPTPPPAPAAPTAAISQSSVAAPTAAPSPTAGPKIKRGGTLRSANATAHDSMDPHQCSGGCFECTNTMFDGLIRFQLNPASKFLEPMPLLIAKWEFTDPSTVVFNLQKGVKFHDGTEWNAEVAKFNLERLMNHKKSRGKDYVASIKSVDTIDPYTIKLNLKEPTAALMANLAPWNNAMHMVSKAAIEKDEEGFLKRPIGSGPFQYVEWIDNNKLTVKRFDGYWVQGEDGKQLPYLDGVVTRIIPDSAVAIMEFKARTLDIATEMEPKDIQAIKSDPELTYYELPYAVRTIPGGGYNQFKPPFDNVKLRQATQYALDREAMAKTLGFGLATPAYYPFWAPGILGWDESLPKYTFNPTKAKELLKEAGYPNGIDIIFDGRNVAKEARAEEMMKNMWDAVGIRTTLQVSERVALFAKLAALEFQIGGWSGDSPPDPDLNRRRLSTGGSMNRSQISDPGLDKCFEEGTTELDAKKRHEIYKKCQTILMEGAYAIHGYAQAVNRILNKRVKGITDDFSKMNFRAVWLDN